VLGGGSNAGEGGASPQLNACPSLHPQTKLSVSGYLGRTCSDYMLALCQKCAFENYNRQDFSDVGLDSETTGRTASPQGEEMLEPACRRRVELTRISTSSSDFCDAGAAAAAAALFEMHLRFK